MLGVLTDMDYFFLLQIYSCTSMYSVHRDYISHLLVLKMRNLVTMHRMSKLEIAL
jgi:hypothetical protein